MNIWRKMRSINLATALLVALGVSIAVDSQVASAAGLPIQAVTPVRLADTRAGERTIDGRYAGMGTRGPRSRTVIKIAGRGNVPADATAVLLNLTDVQLKLGANFLTVYPCTSEPPNASNLNTPAGDIRANNVFVRLSGAGNVCVYSALRSNFIIDVSGYVPAGGSASGVTPARLFDSRRGEKTVDGSQAGVGRRGAGSRTRVQIAGRGGVPTGAEGAIINVTDVLPSSGNVVTVYNQCEADRPYASSLNTPVGDIRANNLYVPLDVDGSICVHTEQETDLVVDVVGYIPDGGTPITVALHRLFDTRPNEENAADKLAGGGGRVSARSTTEVQIAGRGYVPPDATDAIINLTSVLPSSGNLLIAYQCGAVLPAVSNVNSPPNDIRANSAFVKLSGRGTVCIYSEAPTDFVVDVSGYAVVPPVPLRVAENVCGVPTTIGAVVNYYDWGLDGKAVLADQNAAIGGVPPYTYDASGLVGYTIDKATGTLIRTTATSGTVNFTLMVADAGGHEVKLPASVQWEPLAAVDLDYRAFLPKGQTVPAPTFVNWGTPPFTYSLSGHSNVKVDPATGAMTYGPASNYSADGAFTITDSTGNKLVIKLTAFAKNAWYVKVPEKKVIGLGESLGAFDSSGWGLAPYSYALSGLDAKSFTMNSAGQLTVTDPDYLKFLNSFQVDKPGYHSTELNLLVTDAAGTKLTLPVTVAVGRAPSLPILC